MLRAARNQFLGNLVSSAAVLLALVVSPKDDAPESLIRLVMTVAFFLFAISLLWSFTDPLENYVRQRLAWRYAGAGTSIELTLGIIRVNLMAVIRPVALIGMATVGFIGLDVLSAWPAFAVLQPLAPVLQWGWFIGVLLLAIVPLMRGRQLLQLFNLIHQFQEQLATSEFKRKTDAEMEAGLGRPDDPPVTILGEQRFRAGQFDWEWADFYKNLIVFGQPGSGKTVCVLNAILDGLIGSTASTQFPAAGLILDPKGDFKDKIRALMRRSGREHDLLIFDPDSPDSFRWNPFDTPDDALEVANRFGAIFEMQGSEGDNNAFFNQQAKAFLQAVLTAIRLKNPPEKIPSISEVIRLMGSHDTLRKLLDDVWSRTDLPDFQVRLRAAALTYLDEVWMPMSDRTLSAIRATLSNILSPFTYPPFDRVMAGKSTLQLSECIETGKVLYVHFPIARRRLMAQTVGTLLKVEYGRQVLLRVAKPRPTFFFCDEFQVFFTTDKETNDSDFFERSRGSNHANIIATQNRPALLKRSDEEHVVDNLLGNCATKVFLRNTDQSTNKWASELFGEQLETLVNTGRSAGTLNPRQSSAGASVSGASSYAPRVRPEAFSRLAQPSAKDGIGYADSIVHSAARAVVSREDLRWRVHPL
jgi:type IV secretory pathway TraG/TraD family ATPase VirD4